MTKRGIIRRDLLIGAASMATTAAFADGISNNGFSRDQFGSLGGANTQPPAGFQLLATSAAQPVDTSQSQPIAVRVV